MPSNRRFALIVAYTGIFLALSIWDGWLSEKTPAVVMVIIAGYLLHSGFWEYQIFSKDAKLKQMQLDEIKRKRMAKDREWFAGDPAGGTGPFVPEAEAPESK